MSHRLSVVGSAYLRGSRHHIGLNQRSREPTTPIRAITPLSGGLMQNMGTYISTQSCLHLHIDYARLHKCNVRHYGLTLINTERTSSRTSNIILHILMCMTMLPAWAILCWSKDVQVLRLHMHYRWSSAAYLYKLMQSPSYKHIWIYEKIAHV